MALSRFWVFIILLSILSLFVALFTGSFYSLDVIINGKQKERLIVAELSQNDLQQKDPATHAQLNTIKPNARFQKSIKKTSLYTFIENKTDTSASGTILYHQYIDVNDRNTPISADTICSNVDMQQFAAFQQQIIAAPDYSSYSIFCSNANGTFLLNRLMIQNKNTIESSTLKRYNTTPLPLKIQDVWSRLLNDENQLICYNDTLYEMKDNGLVQLSARTIYADGILTTCKNVMTDIWLPLVGIMTFLCGLMNLLKDSNAGNRLANFLTPFFSKIFPELRSGHPAFNYMTLNFAANFLGLDNAATPFGLKAMEAMQEDNADKARASNSQVMFLCLHAAGLTLIPTSIIGYRAAMNASNPTDIMLPIIITSFIGTIAALFFVSIKQRINLLNKTVLLVIVGITSALTLLMVYIFQLTDITKNIFTGNLGNGIFLGIIALILIYSLLKENIFTKNDTNIFASFVEGGKEGLTTAIRILPYMIAMLAAISIFRNSGLMNIVMDGLAKVLAVIGVSSEITNALPTALLRPFSAGGARGFMLDAMKNYGADSLTGRLACLFEGAAETTFYVIAMYYGSVNVKDTRYTLSIMLLVDLVCVITGIFVCQLFFA